LLAALAGVWLGTVATAERALADVYNIPDGDVTALIDAIDAGNVTAGTHTINLAVGGSYTLSAGGLPVITVAGLTINGNGATISGDDVARIFTIDALGDVELVGVNMTHGFAGTAGGAIFNSGQLALFDCIITSELPSR
jgi:hypothetical protein